MQRAVCASARGLAGKNLHPEQTWTQHSLCVSTGARGVLSAFYTLIRDSALPMCLSRSMGVHLSKVRSASLDTWLPEQVQFISCMGNARANIYWEDRLPANFQRPREGDMRQLSTYINAKCAPVQLRARRMDCSPPQSGMCRVRVAQEAGPACQWSQGKPRSGPGCRV